MSISSLYTFELSQINVSTSISGDFNAFFSLRLAFKNPLFDNLGGNLQSEQGQLYQIFNFTQMHQRGLPVSILIF